MPIRTRRIVLAALWAVFLLPLASAFAQTGDTQSDSDALAEAIRQAADSGVGVIIVDGKGQLVSGSDVADGTSDPAAGPAPSPRDDGSMLMHAQSQILDFRETLNERLNALPNSINEVAYILRATSPDGRISTYVTVFLWTALLLGVGYVSAVQIYGRRIVKNFVVSHVREDPQGYREKMPFLVFRFFMGIGGTLFAMLVAYVLGWLIFGRVDDRSIQLTVAAIYAAYFIARTVSDLWRMLLSPFLSQYRIPIFSDRDARRLYYWASALAFYHIATVMFSTWVADFGLNYNVYAALYGALSLVGALLNVLMIVVNARAITNAIRGGQPAERCSWVVRVIARAWAPVLAFYIIFGWFDLVFDLVLERKEEIPLTVGAYAVFLAMVVVYGVINYVIERWFDRTIALRRMQEEHDTADGAEDDAPVAERPAPRRTYQITTFEQLARRVAGILAFVAGAYALLAIWDRESVLLNAGAIDTVLDVMFVLFVGYILYNFFRIWIDSKIAEEIGDGADVEEVEMGTEGGAGGASRLATLLPLFRGAILAIVVIAIGLIALLELGINVSPLFAGAGVVGLAVGFGAQTLVRDIFSGAFFLIDDAFRKGEYIDIESVKGTVEKISVRSFQLRHHLGALHTIPFGEIKVLTNYSRDWVIMKLPLRVTYDTDVEKVRKLVKKLGQELLEDETIGHSFIQPLKSQGVIEMQDNAMIIRVKFMTKPGDQWLVRKKVYEDIRELFHREGIRFAHREVTVRLANADPAKMTEEQRQAVAGAVEMAIEEDMMDGGLNDDR